MIRTGEASVPLRVLVVAPSGRDAELTRKLLVAATIPALIVSDITALAGAIDGSIGCALVTAESLRTGRDKLEAVLADQPPWSDFPIILLTLGVAPDTSRLGNVTTLERPVTSHGLVTAVRAALRARRRQLDARSAIAQRDQFLAMLGHELRNPLAAIVLASEVAAQAKTLDAVLPRLATIKRQSSNLARLVDDLLEVARVTAGKIVLQRGRVDLDEVIAASVAAHDGMARTQGVTVTVAPTAGRAVAIDGDSLRIAQIVDNLITNAIKYTPAGGTVEIAVARETALGICKITVRDTGIGIASDVLPRIFDLFAQADHAIDRSHGGMGIGLTLVKRLVGLHDGTVSASSPGLGQGSEFVVRLPLRPPTEELDVLPALANGSGARAAMRRVRVVLIDDNDDIRELSAGLLASMGCTVEVAADGIAGLAQILEHTPDLALVDIGLPGMNGFDVAQAVRDRLGPRPVLVAVTGYGQASDRERALAAGFDVHLTKPVRGSALKEMIQLAESRISN